MSYKSGTLKPTDNYPECPVRLELYSKINANADGQWSGRREVPISPYRIFVPGLTCRRCTTRSDYAARSRNTTFSITADCTPCLRLCINHRGENTKQRACTEATIIVSPYTGCHRRNGPNFGRVFLMLNYTDITQNTYIQS